MSLSQFKNELKKMAKRIPNRLRSKMESPFQWFSDAIIAFVLCLFGILLAGAIADVTPFLGESAYPTGLLIAWFPVMLWMHYCRVVQIATDRPILCAILVSVLFFFVASPAVIASVMESGPIGLWQMLFALVIILFILPIEAWVAAHLFNCFRQRCKQHQENAT